MPRPLTRRRFLALSGAVAANATLARAVPPATDMPNITELAAGNTAFALDLYAKLRTEPGNVFVSPFSISTALAMTSAGARGDTLAEMTKVLHLPADPHPAFAAQLGKLNGATGKRAYQLRTANAIWAQAGYPWRPAFKELTRKHYGAGLVETDFGMPEAARQAVNGWVAKETNQKIKELIPPGVIDALTRMVLANAISFKADWAAQFKTADTKDAPFHLAGGSKADVPLMTQTRPFKYAETAGVAGKPFRGPVQLLELPYAGQELSMLVLLPAAGDLDQLEAALTPSALAGWSKGMTPRPVRVFLPRFKVEKAVTLNDPLRALGMKAAFSDDTADFSGLHTGAEKLYISHVLHKAFVDVNEEGTEAAAATAVEIRGRSARPEPALFRADRPFLFLIRDTATGGVLFLGRVTNPKG